MHIDTNRHLHHIFSISIQLSHGGGNKPVSVTARRRIGGQSTEQGGACHDFATAGYGALTENVI